jgi:hypothetical protein
MNNNTFLAILLLIGLLSCQSDNTSQYQDWIDEINKEIVPDRRTDRLDVEIKKDGNSYLLVGEAINTDGIKAILTKFENEAIKICNNIKVLPDSTVDQESYGLVRLANCNIRSVPKHSGELATQAVMGTPLRLLQKQGDWYMIQTPEKYIAWVDADAIFLCDNECLQEWKKAEKAIFMAPHGWIYADLNTDFVISDIVAGSVVEVVESATSSTLKVSLPDGRQGFIEEEHFIELKYWSPFSGEILHGIVDDAQQYMGVPYLWGGTSSKGFDCSGFTKTVYALNGMLLPRDASQQVNVGLKIDTDKSWKNLQKGDLLFFGRKRADGSDKITHVAIYMGDGKIIHAAGRVKIESLKPGDPDFAKDRYDSFITARRMWDETPQNNVGLIGNIYQ